MEVQVWVCSYVKVYYQRVQSFHWQIIDTFPLIGITEMLGGRIEVESQLGQGSSKHDRVVPVYLLDEF
jgi:hypothetical protein